MLHCSQKSNLMRILVDYLPKVDAVTDICAQINDTIITEHLPDLVNEVLGTESEIRNQTEFMAPSQITLLSTTDHSYSVAVIDGMAEVQSFDKGDVSVMTSRDPLKFSDCQSSDFRNLRPIPTRKHKNLVIPIESPRELYRRDFAVCNNLDISWE